ncbi:MAG: electron transfer flavoprotein subunit beta/FixA family protein [Desulfamplus sp.]|nr:electron transfer flavoprotein subunit beta/FixA family protein [Desulfamplus sp.]
MRILVCIKQISTSETVIDDSGEWITQVGSSSFAISRFDENAIEEAISLKERLIEKFSSENALLNTQAKDCEIGLQNNQNKDTEIGLQNKDVVIDIISVGGLTAAESIKRGMGMGADNGIHLITEDKGYVSGSVTALRLAAMIKKAGLNQNQNYNTDQNIKNRNSNIGYDLILTGIMSEDLMQAQVGPMLAEYLNIPCVTSVLKVDIIDIEESGSSFNKIIVQREMDGGVRQNIKVKLPALLSIQAGINQPRYPSLSNILKANKKEIQSYHIKELFNSDIKAEVNIDQDNKHEMTYTTKNESQLRDFHIKHTKDKDSICVIRVERPEKRREGRVLNGTTKDKAVELMSILKQRGLLI